MIFFGLDYVIKPKTFCIIMELLDLGVVKKLQIEKLGG